MCCAAWVRRVSTSVTSLSISASGRIDRIQYDNDGWVNSATPLLGFGYRLGPRTDLDLRGGVSFSQQGNTLVPGASEEMESTWAFSADLRHTDQNFSLALNAGRRVASGVSGAGSPPTGSVGAGW